MAFENKTKALATELKTEDGKFCYDVMVSNNSELVVFVNNKQSGGKLTAIKVQPKEDETFYNYVNQRRCTPLDLSSYENEFSLAFTIQNQQCLGKLRLEFEGIDESSDISINVIPNSSYYGNGLITS